MDEDCDGRVDEGFTAGEACSAGVGECAAEGVTVCAEDGLGLTCGAVEGRPEEEVCGDRRDNDCDGETDEGFDLGLPCRAGIGACEVEGVLVCGPGGEYSVCGALPDAPRAERCGNTIDDDCDGETDEDFDLGRPCSVGVGACAAVGVTECNPFGESGCNAVAGCPEPEETCDNGTDDDCNGEVDDGCAKDARDEGCGCAAVGGEPRPSVLRALLRR